MSNRLRLFAPLAAALAAGIATPALAALDLSTYSVKSQTVLDFYEASGVTYNYDKNTLFLVDDEGDDLGEFSVTGTKLRADNISSRDEMSGGYRDIEGVTYIGNGRYVIAEERSQELVLIEPGAVNNSGPLPSTQYTEKPDALKYTIPSNVNVGNNGLEGVAYDPSTGTYFGVRQGGTLNVSTGIYQIDVQFGPPTTGTTTVPFDATMLGLDTLSDIAVLASNPNFAGTDYFGNLLILSLGSNKLVEVTRSGQILSSFDLSGLAVTAIEGVAVGHNGDIYLVGESGPGEPTADDGGRSGLVVLSRATPAVPEPATWAMMAMGFGLVGGIARRRRPAFA